MEQSEYLSVGVCQYERTSDQQRVKVSKPTTMMASEQSQTISQMIASHSHTDKENEIKDLHGCIIININFNK